MNADTARALLDVAPDCTAQELLAAFKARSRMMHPDRFAGRPESEVRMATRDYQRLEQAYRLLSMPPHSSHQPSTAPQRGRDILRAETISADTATFGGVIRVQGGLGIVKVRVAPGATHNTKLRLRGHGNPGVAGGEDGDLIVTLTVGTGTPTRRQRGEDLTRTLTISARQAELGALIGVGGEHGSVMVRIPPGSTDGTTVRVPGHGKPGMAGGESGDLVVVVLVEEPRGSSSHGSAESTGDAGNRPRFFHRLDQVIIFVGVALIVAMVGIGIAANIGRAASDQDSEVTVPTTEVAFDAEWLTSAPCSGEFGCWSWEITPREGCASAGNVVVGVYDSEDQETPTETEMLYFSQLQPGQARVFSLRATAQTQGKYAAVVAIDCP